MDEADGGSGLVVAVLGAQGGAGRAALAEVSRTRPSWAVVRGEDADEPAAATARALRRAGWRVVLAAPGSDLAAAWWRLTGATT